MEKRTISVYKNNLSRENRKKWKSVNSIIEIRRVTVSKGKTKKEIAHFISDLKPEIGAKYFYKGIRSHWKIESFHYIKDKIFLEDEWKVINQPSNSTPTYI